MLGSYPTHLTFLDLVVREMFYEEYKCDVPSYEIFSHATYKRYDTIIQWLSATVSKFRNGIMRCILYINRWVHVSALTFTDFRILFRVFGKRTSQSVNVLNAPAVTGQTFCGGGSCADQ
jgi:hypothetical protein